jgi:hypothetical protein
MTQWKCELTGQREDGAFRWKRIGAEEPNGWVARELVPEKLTIGSHVYIEITNSLGRNSVTACRACETEEVLAAAPTITENSSTHETPEPAPGLLFWVNIINPLEDEKSTGKLRPAVLVSRSAEDWRVMGLTTRSKYESGEDRRPIPNHVAVGLSGPGFIWGHRLTRITADSVKTFIGYANYRLVEEVIDLAENDMSTSEIDDLRSITRPSSSHLNSLSAPSSSESPSMISLTAEGLLRFFTVNSDQISSDLVNYFHSGEYTGRHFETYSRMANPTRFDGNDIAAVMCLSIKPAANMAADLLQLSFSSDATFHVDDRDFPIWRRTRGSYEPGGVFDGVFQSLLTIPNVGNTIASKLLASKVPHSMPIWDRDVAALLDWPKEWWLGWFDAMQNLHLRKKLQQLRNEIHREEVSLLRVADVALWMEAQRRKKSGNL